MATDPFGSYITRPSILTVQNIRPVVHRVKNKSARFQPAIVPAVSLLPILGSS